MIQPDLHRQRGAHEAGAGGTCGHRAVVVQLLAAGADVNAKDNDGYTPLVKAREQKKTAMVTYLKSKGGIDSAKKD